MEAWIVHISEQSMGESGILFTKNQYSAWATEKQANKEVAKFLAKATETISLGPFRDHYALLKAVKGLLEGEKLKEAIDLVHEYSVATPSTQHKNGSSKITIKITQSKFLGSVWE